MKLSEFFKNANTKNIVINTDIDGFLSGMILQEYYGCTVVGFCNSKESIWLKPSIESIKEPVYIDIFIKPSDTYSIDQHIVAFDDDHIIDILKDNTKLNPNLNLSKRSYSGDGGEENNYFHKYPFGTVHFLIAIMKEDGIDVKFNHLAIEHSFIGLDQKKYYTTPGQIILRADDALYSSLGPYEENTNNWWKILSSFESTAIKELINYKDNCEKRENKKYKEEIGKLFINGLNCDGIDGSFDSVTNPGETSIQHRILNYNNIIGSIIGIKLRLPNELIEYRGVLNRSFYDAKKLDSSFTYAFVSSPKRPSQSFSYTIFDID